MRIREIHQQSRGTDGAPRIHAERAASGTGCGRKRVARLMRQAGLVGGHRRRVVKTTGRDATAQAAPALVQRAFRAPAPDRLWVADLTQVPTTQGILDRAVIRDYRAVIRDYRAVIRAVFSRRVVGWSMAAHMRTERVRAAREMALIRRRPPAGLFSGRCIQHFPVGWSGVPAQLEL